MEPAIIGFVGVIVGALLTGALQYFFDYRARRHRAKAAARIVLADLDIVSNSLKTVVQGRSDLTGIPFPVDSWVDHREALAGFLPWRDWRVVTVAFDLMRSYFAALAEVQAGLTEADANLERVQAQLAQQGDPPTADDCSKGLSEEHAAGSTEERSREAYK